MVGFTVRTSTVNSVWDREVVKGVLLFFELVLADISDLTASIVDGREAHGIVREGWGGGEGDWDLEYVLCCGELISGIDAVSRFASWFTGITSYHNIT